MRDVKIETVCFSHDSVPQLRCTYRLDGITLRDVFAAMVAAGVAYRPNGDAADAAKLAYEFADAMLVERAKKGIE